MKDYDISFMKKEFYNFRTKKEDKDNTIAEVDEKRSYRHFDKGTRGIGHNLKACKLPRRSQVRH